MSAKPLYGSSTSVTITLNSLANGSSANSNEINNTTNLALEDELTVNLTGSNAAESGIAEVFILRGDATSAIDDDGNAQRVGFVTLNGTTAVQKTIRVPDLPPFYKYRLTHTSSATYALGASGNSMDVRSVNIQDV